MEITITICKTFWKLTTTQSEGNFQKRVLRDLKKLGHCYFLKTQEKARKGVPDLIICLKGRFIAIELKREGEEPTELQEYVLDKILRAGGAAMPATPSTWPAIYSWLLQEDHHAR